MCRVWELSSEDMAPVAAINPEVWGSMAQNLRWGLARCLVPVTPLNPKTLNFLVWGSIVQNLRWGSPAA